MRIRPPLAALAALAAFVALAGCGEKEEPLGSAAPRPFELLLDYFPNADHAGIYAAQAKGRFEAVGLDVRIRQPSDPAAPIKQVAAGRVDLAISYEPEVLRARDEGLDVVAVGALVRVPLTSIISLPEAGISSPADLEGKTVGTAGIDYQSAYLQTILADAGVDPEGVTERNVGFSLSPALLTRKVDAVLGAFWNYEGTELRLRKRDPRIIRMEEAGVPPYNELVLVANKGSLEQKGDEIRRFIGALAAGTKDLERDPAEAIRGLLDANRDLDRKLQRAVVKTTLPFFLPPKGKPFGWQDPDEWEEFATWARENGIIKRLPTPGEAYTNELLPGEGL
ncbi:MAG TPA: ABC transporter substrate-binding protein [Thermoleophilaceae bacterium]|nr:ABC transporter substrate-binding protein [Thermoleophilaceae bacterium]